MSDGDIAVMENQNQQPMTLIEQTDPAIIIADATNIANQLADIIKQKKLFKRIGTKDHVYVEGWTTLGALTKVFPVLEYSKRLDRDDEIAYESRVIAQTIKGEVVGTGEALCSNKEGNWRGRDEYAIKSMSQTRATSKALRIPLGWIMTLAGYSATPAEEMTESNRQAGRPAPARGSGRRPAPARKAPSRMSDDAAANDAIDAEFKVKPKPAKPTKPLEKDKSVKPVSSKEEETKPEEPETHDMTGVDVKKIKRINKELDIWIGTVEDVGVTKSEVIEQCQDMIGKSEMTAEEFERVKKAMGD